VAATEEAEAAAVVVVEDLAVAEAVEEVAVATEVVLPLVANELQLLRPVIT